MGRTLPIDPKSSFLHAGSHGNQAAKIKYLKIWKCCRRARRMQVWAVLVPKPLGPRCAPRVPVCHAGWGRVCRGSRRACSLPSPAPPDTSLSPGSLFPLFASHVIPRHQRGPSRAGRRGLSQAGSRGLWLQGLHPALPNPPETLNQKTSKEIFATVLLPALMVYSVIPLGNTWPFLSHQAGMLQGRD